jgi:poly [ADP-ribose] polymerase
MRIAPPEAPKTGYRFGKGAYFADVIGKSASYSRNDASDEVLIMACEVALGEEWETKKDKFMDKPQAGSHCTHALGKFAPKPDGDVDDGTGCVVPAGDVEKTATAKSSVNVNEFIVYSTDQVRIRYLLRLKLGEEDE